METVETVTADDLLLQLEAAKQAFESVHRKKSAHVYLSQESWRILAEAGKLSNTGLSYSIKPQRTYFTLA